MADQLATDRAWMAEAIRIAEPALGRVAPNPAVGAVIVRDGIVVGRGRTEPPGGHHAERVALDEAGELARGATIYVTLEPCCHHGRTSPCADALIEAGIARCVVAMIDPYELVNGGGIARMRAAGMTVDVGVLADEAAELNAGFVTRVRTGRPLVTLKFAMSLDGKIATRTGASRWITGPDARAVAHRLRDRSDAIMVGAGTVLADDPELTTRIPDASEPVHHPLRVIVDGAGRAPVTARVFDPALPGKTLVATTSSAPEAWQRALRERGVAVVTIGPGPRFALGHLLDALGESGINSLLVEGGATLSGDLVDGGHVDRVVAFIAPTLIGGSSAPGPIGGEGAETPGAGLRLTDVRLERAGEDIVLFARVARSDERERADV